MQTHEDVVLGDAGYRYRLLADWAKLPSGTSMEGVAGIAVDRHDNVYAFARKASAPILVFDRNGAFLRSWGEGEFGIPHALHIGPDDTIYCSDTGKHVVRKYTLEGKLLFELGIPDKPAPAYSGNPFNKCTHTALSPDNETIYVSDGYGNARVHRYTQKGKLLASWGSPGIDDGQFNIAHNICCDAAGWVYVADRENHRVQVFDPNGAFETKWDHVHRPCGLAVESPATGLGYVTELAPAMSVNIDVPNLGARVSVVAKDGTILSRLNNDANASPAYKFYTPHCIAVDSHGDIYVADTQGDFAKKYPDVPRGLGTLKKLVKEK